MLKPWIALNPTYIKLFPIYIHSNDKVSFINRDSKRLTITIIDTIELRIYYNKSCVPGFRPLLSKMMVIKHCDGVDLITKTTTKWLGGGQWIPRGMVHMLGVCTISLCYSEWFTF